MSSKSARTGPAPRTTHRSITIETVAAAAGVSTMTVSRVLRGTGNVSADTIVRVESCIEELGYVHNRLAGALASSHGAQIAVIVPTLQSIVFTEVLAGIAAGLENEDYQPVIGITEYEVQREYELVKSMLAWRPAGIVLANTQHLEKTRKLLRNVNCPVVEIMELTSNPIDMCVGLDQKQAGSAMAEHLVKKGYKRFAYLGSDHAADRGAALRFDGFTAVLQKHKTKLCAKLTVNETSGIGLGRKHMGTLLAQAGNAEVVYFSNDAVAAGAMMYCLHEGLKVPEDIALASFSGLDIAAAMPVPITTVRSPRFEMGKLSAERILGRLRGQRVRKVTDAGFELLKGASA